MLFKPDAKDDGTNAAPRKRSLLSRLLGRMVSLVVTLVILGGLGYLGWLAFQPKQGGGGGRGAGARPDLPVPVLAATPHVADVPVYLDGVGSVKALNTVTVRSQVDGKLLKVNFVEGQDVKKDDVLGEIDPVIYQAQYDQAVAKKAQDVALLTNQKLDLARYEQLAASNAGSKQQADTTGLVILTQLQPIAVWFSLPQQQIMRVNAAAAKGPLAVDVFGNDGVTVIDTGKLTGIDNQVDPTTGTLKLKAEFPNASYQLWPGQFVNVRLKVETLPQAIVVPTSAVQRGPAGTFSYVIGEGNVVTAKPVTVTQQNEHEAVIASGLTTSDRVVTTGFANLADGSKVVVGKDDGAPTADLAPRKRSRNPDGKRGGQGQGAAQGDAQGKDGKKDGQGKNGEHHGRHEHSDGDQKGQTGPAPAAGGEQSGSAPKAQP